MGLGEIIVMGVILAVIVYFVYDRKFKN